ncbi:hypothetical protein MLD38_026723 [Melastoma candidum]|uniref:Uncharacterized protein n=1 Tax=Melastoma candidum TaxID=119954 RepID=A0ACB9P0V1_9MYRT|nr:hypothetical protein MLD38_026723 [Melastoma candidum]
MKTWSHAQYITGLNGPTMIMPLVELMCKVSGIDAADFDGFPIEAKSCEAYTSILHCGADAKLIDKAEDLYGKIESPNIAFNDLVYNEMMTVLVRGAARRSSVCCRRNVVQEGNP